MLAAHHPVATQLAVDLGFINATPLPLTEQQDKRLSSKVSIIPLCIRVPRSMHLE